jgi:hypothetical protein
MRNEQRIMAERSKLFKEKSDLIIHDTRTSVTSFSIPYSSFLVARCSLLVGETR